jgi:hypothetical protein
MLLCTTTLPDTRHAPRHPDHDALELERPNSHPFKRGLRHRPPHTDNPWDQLGHMSRTYIVSWGAASRWQSRPRRPHQIRPDLDPDPRPTSAGPLSGFASSWAGKGGRWGVGWGVYLARAPLPTLTLAPPVSSAVLPVKPAEYLASFAFAVRCSSWSRWSMPLAISSGRAVCSPRMSV